MAPLGAWRQYLWQTEVSSMCFGYWICKENVNRPLSKTSVLTKLGLWIYCPQSGHNSRSQQLEVLHPPEPRLIVGKSDDSL